MKLLPALDNGWQPLRTIRELIIFIENLPDNTLLCTNGRFPIIVQFQLGQLYKKQWDHYSLLKIQYYKEILRNDPNLVATYKQAYNDATSKEPGYYSCAAEIVNDWKTGELKENYPMLYQAIQHIKQYE